MSTTFLNALSGLKANADAIDMVSVNLSNLNTYGYKNTGVSFEDLLSQGMVGSTDHVGGSVVAKSTRTFTQGSMQSTGQPFDAAVQGSGFFVLRTAQGQQVFSRAGNFKVDAAGHLLTAGGQYVQGWNAVNGSLTPTGGVSDITVPIVGLQQPRATTKISISSNLNAAAAVGSSDAKFASPIPVVDSLGTTHTLTVTYTKTAGNTWTYDVTIPSSDLTAGAATPSTSLASGTLTFDGAGHLLTPAAAAGNVPVAINGLADGASNLSLNWGLYDASGAATVTQYSQASANLGSAQDGSPSGQLINMSIGAGGQVLAQYSNGGAVAVAQLALGSVLNPDSLKDLGGGMFGLSSATSLPSIGMPGTGTRGSILGGALESSTVDIAKEFTNLLIYQRGYQANSKLITTEDEIMQETVALKR